MRTVFIGALIGALVAGVGAALLGADFNSGLAPAELKARHGFEGAIVWGIGGLIIGGLVGATLGGIVAARHRK